MDVALRAGAVAGLSLCSGAGGLELGVHLVLPEYRCVGYVEREARAAAALVARMEAQELAPAPVWDDLKTFDGRPWRGAVDLLTAGYPCQPFSTAGKRAGEADPRHLWPDVHRVIEEVRPAGVFLENVAAHLTRGFDAVRRDLERVGYEVAAGVFSAAEVGATHKRACLFILAHAARAGLRDGGGRLPGHGLPDQRRSALADTGGARLPDSQPADIRDARRREEWGAASELRCAPVADADRQRRSLGHASEPYPITGRSGAADPLGGGETLAHTNGRGRGRRRLEEPAGLERSARPLADRCGADRLIGRLPLFPPGPGDDDRPAWARVLAEVPEVEPALCRMAHGLAGRVDRLRLTGNGVVPVAAAVAFVSLWLELRGRQ
jgi:DNA (cytosine-5)-methyltransferase 1